MKTFARGTWLFLGVMLLFTFGCAAPCTNLRPSEVSTADYYLRGDIEEQSADILEMLTRKDGAPALIEIDSPGGVADEGILIYRILRAAKSPTTCLVNGRAASAAFVILQGCTRRAMTSTSYLFTHEPSVVFGEAVSLNPAVMEAVMVSLKKTSDLMASIISTRMGMGVIDYRKRIGFEGWRMDSDAAIDANAIDVVVDGTPVDLSAPAPDIGDK